MAINCSSESQDEPPSDDYDRFDAKFYLERYLGEITAISSVLEEYVRIFSPFPNDSLTVLNFGGGPDLLPLIYQAHKVREYVHADYARSNLTEVERWIKGDSTAFSWEGHVRHCLDLENSDEAVERREKRMRDVFKAAIHCDIYDEQVVPYEYRGPYDYVVCIDVLDCICRSAEAFETSVKRLSGLVKVGGYLHIEMSFDTEDTKCSSSYEVGNVVYLKWLSVNLSSIVETVKAQGFSITHVFQYVEDNEATAKYKDHIAMVVARKDAERVN